MHIFEQSTGKWIGPDASMWGQGWAGQLAGRNNPAMQNVPNVGPLPEGIYMIGYAYDHPVLGPVTMDLEPDLINIMFGRSAFRVHGFGADVIRASEGCVIQIRPVRERIDSSTDRILRVVASLTPLGLGL